MERSPPPLTPTTYEVLREELAGHEHAVFTYDETPELAVALRALLDGGLRAQEQCVFIHSFDTEEEAWRVVEAAHPEAQRLRADQFVLVSLYTDAFEGGRRRIDYDHVKSVVDGVIEGAQSAGRRGVRILVDASRRYLREDRTAEWFAFEAWLGRRLHQNVGLVCAYQRRDAMRPDIFPQILATHAYRFGVKPE